MVYYLRGTTLFVVAHTKIEKKDDGASKKTRVNHGLYRPCIVYKMLYPNEILNLNFVSKFRSVILWYFPVTASPHSNYFEFGNQNLGSNSTEVFTVVHNHLCCRHHRRLCTPSWWISGGGEYCQPLRRTLEPLRLLLLWLLARVCVARPPPPRVWPAASSSRRRSR